MVDKKISALDASTSLASTDVFPVVDVGSTVTKKITISNVESGLSHTNIQDIGTLTHAQLESNLTTVSGATVTNATDLVTVSGALVSDIADLVVVSGATVTNKTNTTNLSGVVVTVSGALVSDIADLVTVSGATVTNKNNLATVSGAGVAVSGASTTHIADNTQAHSDYLLNNANDSTTGSLVALQITVTRDNSSADTAYVPMVLYNTDATPPAASGFPIGTIYVQYTA